MAIRRSVDPGFVRPEGAKRKEPHREGPVVPGKQSVTAHALRRPDLSRRPVRGADLDGRRAACRPGPGRRFGDGGGGRAARRNCGRLLCRRIRGHAFPDLRSHCADDRRHDGHPHHPRVESDRGADGGRARGSASDAPRAGENRALRGLHALRRRVRVHVGHRHHRHPDPDPADPRGAARAGAAPWARSGRCRRRLVWRT